VLPQCEARQRLVELLFLQARVGSDPVWHHIELV